MEIEWPLKFKASFREDYDPFFPTKETQWNDQLSKRGLRPDLTDGKAIERLIRGSNPSHEVPDNMFPEAILDNVVDLGELVLQHFACNVDRAETNRNGRPHRLNKRVSKRLSKELGVKVACNIQEDKDPPGYRPPTPQDLHDGAAFPEWEGVQWNQRGDGFPRTR